MIAEQGSEERHVYRLESKEHDIVDQAAKFWNDILESKGTGNISDERLRGGKTRD